MAKNKEDSTSKDIKPNTKPDETKDPTEITIDPNQSVADTVKEVEENKPPKDDPANKGDDKDETTEDPKPTLDAEAIKKQAKDELREELKGEVQTEVTNKIVESLTGKKEGEEAPAYLKFIKDIQEKEKRDPTYAEALTFLKEATKTEIMAELKQKDDDKDKADEDAKDAEQKKNDAWNAHWSSQLEELEEAELIPKIANEQNKNDPGIKARIALFTAMRENNERRKEEGKLETYSLKEVYYEVYSKREVPGADAPIAGANKGVSQGEKGYSYEDVHNPTMEDIVREHQK